MLVDIQEALPVPRLHANGHSECLIALGAFPSLCDLQILCARSPIHLQEGIFIRDAALGLHRPDTDGRQSVGEGIHLRRAHIVKPDLPPVIPRLLHRIVPGEVPVILDHILADIGKLSYGRRADQRGDPDGLFLPEQIICDLAAFQEGHGGNQEYIMDFIRCLLATCLCPCFFSLP